MGFLYDVINKLQDKKKHGEIKEIYPKMKKIKRNTYNNENQNRLGKYFKNIEFKENFMNYK